MNLSKQSFSHNGRTLEVRAELLTHAWHVGVFAENGELLLGGIARCSRKDVESARRRRGVSLVDQVMRRVQRKVKSGELRLP